MEKENFDKHFSEKEVEELCKKYNRSMDDFHHFMRGQTYSLDEKGECAMYGCDVKRFFYKLPVVD